MDLTTREALANMRLFRPLGFASPYHASHPTDAELIDSILDWTKRILLGGMHYNLGVGREAIFQIQSGLLNRHVYVIPVWDPDLVREIVLASEGKTERAQNGCGLGPPDDLAFYGGIVVLSRVFFRGPPAFRREHGSDSGWFNQDRYYLDVFFGRPRDDRAAQTDETTSSGQLDWRGHAESLQHQRAFRAVLRVFHNSVACVSNPMARWNPADTVDTANEAVRAHTPEYFPSADELILDWHELAALFDGTRAGIYGLTNFTASETAAGRGWRVTDEDYFFGIRNAPTQETIDLSAETESLWSVIDRPLPPNLAASYDQFLRRTPGTGLRPFDVARNTQTKLFESPLSAALVRYLLTRAAGSARYVGHGYFRMRATNGTTLAAGTGKWGSGETAETTIETTATSNGTSSEPVDGSGVVEGSGLAGLVAEVVRYIYKDDVAAEIQQCRQGTSAECQECIDASIADTLHDAGTITDIVDLVGGIAGCIIASVYGQPWVCGITLPVAFDAFSDLEESFSGEDDLAEDLCSGLPPTTPSSSAGGPSACETYQLPVLVDFDGNVVIPSPEEMTALCVSTFGRLTRDRYGSTYYFRDAAYRSEVQSIECTYCILNA